MSNDNGANISSPRSSKDKYIMVAIHQLMEEYGWRDIEKQFGVIHSHFIFIKPDSFLDKIEVNSNLLGNHIDVDFLGVTPKKGILDKVFDFNIRVVRRQYDVSEYVADDYQIKNESNLRNSVLLAIKQLEEFAQEHSKKDM